MEFAVPDADGVEHTYRFDLYGAEEGWALTLDVGAFLTERLWPLLDLVDEDVDLDKLMGKVDEVGAEALAERIQDLLKSKEARALVWRMIRGCTRDGQPLFEQENRDAAYRNNYGEVSLAAWKILSGNAFSPLPSLFSGRGEAASPD